MQTNTKTHSVHIKEIRTDVLVIGSGGAGIRAAIELNDNKIDVLVVGKCKKRDAHTILATGGINAALGTLDKADSWQLHAADTILDGGSLNNPKAVEILCKHAPAAVKELACWGCQFHKEKNGKMTQRFFGAATYRRACFVGDQTGKAILNTLIDQAVKRKIRFKSEVYIFSLLKSKGVVNGALGLELRTGSIIIFSAKTVVLCTGGHSRMFKQSSSRFWENNGDGIALAYDLGAHFMDMEMFQFHPTGMVWPKEVAGTLVTEAVRGEGGILTNIKGERFMKNYDAQRMELSARDIVARAIYYERKAGRGTKRGGVYLDITQKSKGYIQRRLPKMFAQFKKHVGIDISKQKMEVAPTAHYSMGGIYVDHSTGKTTIPQLYAIGEVTAGVHGGNRLGGNSLAEIVVFGKLTGQYITKNMKKVRRIPIDKKLVEEKIQWLQKLCGSKKGKNPIALKEEIQSLMWDAVGVVRNAKDMKKARKQLEKYKKIQLAVPHPLKMNQKLIAALDVTHMYATCAMIIASALLREESRAAHARSDYPLLSPKWKKNIFCVPDHVSFTCETKPVPKVSSLIAPFLGKKRNLESHVLE